MAVMAVADVAVVGLGVVQLGGGAQGLEQDGALERGEPEGAGQGPVVVEPEGQPALDPGRGVAGAGDLAVGAGEPLELVRRHRRGDLGQTLLGARSRDPGQRPDLGIGQPSGPELGTDDRQVPQRSRHPDVFPGGAGGQLALPGQPLGAAVHLPARPPSAGIEIAEQDQEPARRRGQVPGQLTDLRLQSLQRHPAGRTKVSGGRIGFSGGRIGGQGAGTGPCLIEHVFDVSIRV